MDSQAPLLFQRAPGALLICPTAFVHLRLCWLLGASRGTAKAKMNVLCLCPVPSLLAGVAEEGTQVRGRHPGWSRWA